LDAFVQIVKELIIIAAITIYFVINLRYSFALRKSVVFTGKIKTLHLVLIWLIPFVWIFILKNLTKRTKGSYEVENKEAPIPFSDNDDDASRASQMGY
jgi:hypothetical protein